MGAALPPALPAGHLRPVAPTLLPPGSPETGIGGALLVCARNVTKLRACVAWPAPTGARRRPAGVRRCLFRRWMDTWGGWGGVGWRLVRLEVPGMGGVAWRQVCFHH